MSLTTRRGPGRPRGRFRFEAEQRRRSNAPAVPPWTTGGTRRGRVRAGRCVASKAESVVARRGLGAHTPLDVAAGLWRRGGRTLCARPRRQRAASRAGARRRRRGRKRGGSRAWRWADYPVSSVRQRRDRRRMSRRRSHLPRSSSLGARSCCSSFRGVSALIADMPATAHLGRRRVPGGELLGRVMARLPASASETGRRRWAAVGGCAQRRPHRLLGAGRSRRSADRSSPAHATTRTRGRDSAHAFADRSAWVARPLAPAQPRRLEMPGHREDRSGPGSHKAIRTKARLTRRTPPKIIGPTRAKRRTHG
jgi:hypothetical protein